MGAAGKRLLFQAKEGKTCRGRLGTQNRSNSPAFGLTIPPSIVWGDSAMPTAGSRFPRSPSYRMYCPRALLQAPARWDLGKPVQKPFPATRPRLRE